MVGSLSIIVAQHMYAMNPYPYMGIDYATQISLFTHHMWIGGFFVVGGAAHGAIYMVRDYDPAVNRNNVLDRVLRHRDAAVWSGGPARGSSCRGTLKGKTVRIRRGPAAVIGDDAGTCRHCSVATLRGRCGKAPAEDDP
jgi:hypothetical protein